MAEPAVFKTRSPLSEAAHRINANYAPSDNIKSTRARGEQVDTQSRASHQQNAPPTNHVASPLTCHPPGPTVLRPPQESDEAKRLSQASYESGSSRSSKRNYKTHIGPWQLGRTLGKGSSARVRLCRHNVTNQLAAVKIVNRRMAYLVQDSSLAALSKWDNNNDATSGSSGEMRVPMSIEREVAILKLIEHPHIMKLYDIWENRSEM